MSDAVVSGSADKRQKINKKKKEQADQKRKYDSRHIYFGNTSDEWERQRTIFGKYHSWFAAHLLDYWKGMRVRPVCHTMRRSSSWTVNKNKNKKFIVDPNTN